MLKVSTKENIILQAFLLFSRKGYRDTSLNEIVHKAKVTKGAFYYYYKSKEELFIEIMNIYFFSFYDESFLFLDSHNGPIDSDLRAFFKMASDLVVQNIIPGKGKKSSDGYFLMVFEGVLKIKKIKEKMIQVNRKFISSLEDYFLRAKERKEIKEDIDCELLAFQTGAIIEGTYDFYNADSAINLGEKFAAIAENILKTIKP